MFVSVIIPVYNDSEGLRLCLEALEKQTYPSDAYEVIVVDNNSKEDIAAVTGAFTQVRLIHESRQGSYAARNQGISIAKGEILGFTDSDCIPDPAWIEQGIKALKATPNCGLVAGNIEFYFKVPNQPTPAELYDSTRFLQQKRFVEEMHFGATANVFTYKAVFGKVGLFNDSLKSGGDQEWGKRVFSHDYTLTYAENAKIQHPARGSLKELRKKLRRVFQGDFELNGHGATPLRTFLWKTVRDLKPPLRYIAETLADKSLGNLNYRVSYVGIYLIVKYERLIRQIRLYFRHSSANKATI